MERSRERLFSLVLNCFSPAKPYQEQEKDNNNIELPQEEEDGDNDNVEQPPHCIEEEKEEEEEYTEDFEVGVGITVQRLAGGSLQIKRIKFSRKVFSEVQAKLWWEENGARVRQQYNSTANI